MKWIPKKPRNSRIFRAQIVGLRQVERQAKNLRSWLRLGLGLPGLSSTTTESKSTCSSMAKKVPKFVWFQICTMFVCLFICLFDWFVCLFVCLDTESKSTCYSMAKKVSKFVKFQMCPKVCLFWKKNMFFNGKWVFKFVWFQLCTARPLGSNISTNPITITRIFLHWPMEQI